VRQWLIKNNFQGLENQTVPIMSDDYVNLVSDRYIELYENITGDKFRKSDTSSIVKRIQLNVDNFLSSYE